MAAPRPVDPLHGLIGTFVLCLGVLAAGLIAILQATAGGTAFTTETLRRTAVLQAPVAVPDANAKFGTADVPGVGSSTASIQTALVDDDESAACTGNSRVPSAPAGRLCLYVTNVLNIRPGSLLVIAGTSGNSAGPDNAIGFFVRSESAAAGDFTTRGTWAYTAP